MRLLICAAGLAASLATPGLAVAHGHAHHELAEHVAIVAAPAAAVPSASSTDHDSEHPHGSIQQAVTTRLSTVAPAVISAVAVVAAASFTSADVGESTAREEPERCWAERPPSAPRAPPTVS